MGTRLEVLRDRVAAVTITEVSADRSVEVTVSATGVLVDLVLRDWGAARSPQVATRIMENLRRAQSRAATAMREALSDGGQDVHTALIASDVARRFPEPPPDTEDWDARTVMDED